MTSIRNSPSHFYFACKFNCHAEDWSTISSSYIVAKAGSQSLKKNHQLNQFSIKQRSARWKGVTAASIFGV
jgi:hypothetical protein